MIHLCQEIRAYARACEHLLCKRETLTVDERELLDYYMNELSREFLSDHPTVRLGHNQTASANPARPT